NKTRFNVDLDDSQVTYCKKLAEEINHRLAMEEKETELYQTYGYTVRPEAPKAVQDARPTAEVLKDAKKALAEEDTSKVADNN
ncbi:MAG: hypothetical protein ACRD36_12520, partial [Candidatus Acidiferrum sp.]